MSFEVRDKDLLGRIGKLRTKSGDLETPAFMPVINPLLQTITPKRMKRNFGCNIIITNSYIIKKNFEKAADLNIHKLLDYDGVIMTDSGAYQILVYGGIEVTQSEIIDFQKRIGSDISVILDVPTGWDVSRDKVEYTVEETLKRAKSALPLIENSNSLWVGPVQGGRHIDLVALSAEKIGKMPYDIHALGSPTEVMERYMFPVLVDMTMTAKKNLPIERPFHLFGAGHPMIFAITVAMGCDLFDSAAYAIYAKNMRYMTNRGTILVENLQYLPCTCPACRSINAKELKNLPKGERQRIITEHNLHVTMAEIEKVKQAIVEGNLWDLIEARAKSHPQLTAAMKRLATYRKYIEKFSSSFKGQGVFYYSYNSLAKPQITRHQIQLKTNYGKPEKMEILLLFKAPPSKPYNNYPKFLEIKEKVKDKLNTVNICFYAAPYGVVPEFLAETYPLSQYEMAEPLDHETIEFTVRKIVEYIKYTNHNRVILICNGSPIDQRLRQLLSELNFNSEVIQGEKIWDNETAIKLFSLL